MLAGKNHSREICWRALFHILVAYVASEERLNNIEKLLELYHKLFGPLLRLLGTRHLFIHFVELIRLINTRQLGLVIFVVSVKLLGLQYPIGFIFLLPFVVLGHEFHLFICEVDIPLQPTALFLFLVQEPLVLFQVLFVLVRRF